jgi:hypothetical protein
MDKNHLVETENRRSPSVKQRNNGFRGNTCSKANCIGCSQIPPTLESEAIRKLGSDFCQLDPSLLTDECLLKRNLKAGKVGKKPTKGKDKKHKDEKRMEGGLPTL